METGTKKLAISFAIATGVALSTGIGIGYYAAQNNNEEAASPAASGSLNAVEVLVTKTAEDNVLHVRLHPWVAQFKMASVCVRGMVSAPKPCTFEADIAGSPKTGQTVTLQNLARTAGEIKPHSVAVSIPSIGARQDRLEGPVSAKVTKILDGDTVRITAEILPGHYVMTDIRIGEIDTPEKKGRAKCDAEAALAEKASAATSNLIEGKTVLLYNVQFEKYGGRVLGDVRTENGSSAAQNLIDKGLAKPYGGGTKQSWCARN